MTDEPPARALWIEGRGKCALVAEEIAAPADGEVLIRARHGGISRGTESLVLSGGVPEDQFTAMKCPYQAGEFSFPVKYGYCVVGTVEAGPERLLGRTIFCLHPHQSEFIVREADVHEIPDGVPPGRAILAANMETALNIVWDAGLLPGDRVAVFGAGVVGLLTAHIASRVPGAEVTLVDINPQRREISAQLGIGFAMPPDLPRECDLVVNCSASEEALSEALACAGVEARIVEASWYGDRAVNLILGSAFHSRRLSIVSSQVGTIPSSRSRRWTPARRMAKALELLKDARLDLLISGETRFGALAEAYAEIIASPATLCHRIVY
ncbi:zinc-binding alcohol dehydrogenase [Phyllobacterium sp. 0TCS1.6C]|uniref:zinc-dependent alcohol dehydrogenase n=1 Tax=unclassified Phyllobacterium TaxID=2638441 RepID=UPI0022652AF6|nr:MULTISPECIES: zinc-binding alcohol dehydrogenase [unclassified Phyllobacterium]MCX8280232.1 zinc-binding alcohol dehydrogenase [Phyllobacterium sp. 0TCS1.6C]MCX8294207.1 zinc-binding alcohol dehydrogenase [Phyllobacterium sp. 0TCS1.6A]